MAKELDVNWFLPYLKSLSLNESFTPNTSTEINFNREDKIFYFTDNLRKSRKYEERCSQDFRYFNIEGASVEVSVPPVTVAYLEDCGRFIQASRDIDAGETMFWEPPLVLSPKGGSGPTCLNCFMSFTESNWPVCEECKCPKCKDNCEGNEHSELECKILADAFKNTDITSNENLVKRLNIILTPFRTYLAIKKSPAIEQIVESLQSNSYERKKSSIGEFIEKYVANFFQNEANINVDSDFVHHVCGVFDTNAFNVTIKNQNQARALLPLSSLMNHSCVPNTQHWFLFGYLVVRACIPIKKGEIITNSYTQSLWGTKTRISYLALTKLFRCKCQRCQDPSELGSNLSSIKCQKCKEGLLTPMASKSVSCNECGETMPTSSIANILNVFTGVVTRAENMDIDIISKTIQNLGKMIGLQHFTTVKLQFIYLRKIVSQQRNVNFKKLVESLPIVESLLQLTAKIEPGLTRTKGILLYYKLTVLTELLSRFDRTSNDESFNESEINKLKASISREDVGKIFEECELILKWDSLLEDMLETRERWKILKGYNRNYNTNHKEITDISVLSSADYSNED